MPVDRELKIFTRFKSFWMGQGIMDPKDPKFQWIIQNNPDIILLKEPWRASNLAPVPTFRRFHIETSTACNSNCIICPHSKITRKGTIDVERIKKLITEELMEYKLNVSLVEFHNYNEPFLDFDLFYDLASLVMNFIGKYRVGVVTNGSIMNRQIAMKLMGLKLQHIIFSVDGFSKEVYEKQRVGLNRDEVYSNIDLFCEVSSKYNGVIPTISFTITDKNKHEIEDFKKYWKTRRVNINIQGCDGRGGTDKEPVFSKDCYNGPCTYALEGVYILSNLDVVPCCLDWSGKAVMGNLGKQSLKDILAGEKYNQFRLLHVIWRKNEIPLCRDCKTHMALTPSKGTYFGYLETIREG